MKSGLAASTSGAALQQQASRATILALAEAGADKLDAMVATLMGTNTADAKVLAKDIRKEADAVRECIRFAKALPEASH